MNVSACYGMFQLLCNCSELTASLKFNHCVADERTASQRCSIGIPVARNKKLPANVIS
jgi:hypothetical protein